MPRTFNIIVPAKPHIAKFVAKRYGSPIRLSNDNTVGLLLRGLLQRPTFNSKRTSRDKDIRFAHFTATITFQAPISDIRHVGFVLSDDHIIHLNAFIEEHFAEVLSLYCHAFQRYGSRYRGIKDLLYQFAEFYNIDIPDDISFEGLKKIEYRMRKSMDKFVAGLSRPENALQTFVLARPAATA